MNNTDKKEMIQIVGEALEEVVLPTLYGVKNDIKVLKNDVKDLKDDVTEIKQRLEKVEFNTRIYPHDKEYVDKKFNNHEKRISRLEFKTR